MATAIEKGEKQVTVTEIKGALGPMQVEELKIIRETLANHLLGFRPLPENKPVIAKFDTYLSSVIEEAIYPGVRR